MKRVKRVEASLNTFMVPEKLSKGDVIGVCAPSGAFDPNHFHSGLGVLESMGFRVKLSDGLSAKKRYLAGGDTHRAAGVTAMFRDPEVKAVLCARGGFGALRILDLINYDRIRQSPKFFVGFSDVTALLAAMMMKSGIQVVHGPVVTSLAKADQMTLDSLFSVLTGSFETEIAVGNRVLRHGKASGILAGGNIATLAHLTGTRYQPDFSGCILFIEDVGEAPYRIDRMLFHLRLAGALEGVAGVLAGSFENCGDLDTIHEILLEVFDKANVPIIAGLPVGHGTTNLCLPLGIRVSMESETFRVMRT